MQRFLLAFKRKFTAESHHKTHKHILKKKQKKTVKSAETKHSRKIAVNQAPYSQLTANRAIHQFYSTAWKERNLVTYETVEFDRQAHILHN